MGARMLEILMRGVSTRNYKEVIPTMAETVGVSKSAVSRRVVEASQAEVEALLSRRFDELKLLVIYIDGLLFGDYTMIGAVGVDSEGNKHVLGIREGATENSTVVKELLEDIVARGVDLKRKRLFVIDGSKALRAAINELFRRGSVPRAIVTPPVSQLSRHCRDNCTRPSDEPARQTLTTRPPRAPRPGHGLRRPRRHPLSGILRRPAALVRLAGHRPGGADEPGGFGARAAPPGEPQSFRFNACTGPVRIRRGHRCVYPAHEVRPHESLSGQNHLSPAPRACVPFRQSGCWFCRARTCLPGPLAWCAPANSQPRWKTEA